MQRATAPLSQLRPGDGERAVWRSCEEDSSVADVSLVGTVAVVQLMPARLTDPEPLDHLSEVLTVVAATPGVLGMVVDFAHVRYASSRVFTLLIKARNLVSRRRGKVAVAGMPEEVAEAMRILHLDRIIGRHRDIDAAVAACR